MSAKAEVPRLGRMLSRLLRLTALSVLVAVSTAGCLPGGGTVTSPCDGPPDDDATAVVVSSADENAPDVIRGCIDSSSDVDTITLTEPSGATGTGTYNVRCVAQAGVADFDTPTVLGPGTPCLAANAPYYVTGNQTSLTVTVFAHEGGDGGEYRLEILVA